EKSLALVLEQGSLRQWSGQRSPKPESLGKEVLNRGLGKEVLG
ncbi:hypothetical protein A2U01_0106418, partial [Trifolium medium]|nr:hypothetical protein [Trifolium medium]